MFYWICKKLNMHFKNKNFPAKLYEMFVSEKKNSPHFAGMFFLHINTHLFD